MTRTTRFTLSLLPLVFAVAVPLAGRLVAQGASSVTVKDAWVREPTGNRTEAAVFAVVENASATKRSIVSGTTAAADKLELHEMKMAGAMMQMSPVKKIDVPAHGKTELKSGGFHIMLFGFKKPAEGENVNVTLTLDDGSTVSFAAPVRKEAMK